MSLALARFQARQARVLEDRQQNPLSVLRAAMEDERQKGSFKALCEDWYRVEVQARGLKHPGVPRRYLDKYLVPKLGRLAARDITPADVARMLDDLKGRAPTAANNLLRFTQRIFAFGVRRRIAPSNPAADFPPRLDADETERARSRALGTDELPQLLEKMRETANFSLAPPPNSASVHAARGTSPRAARDCHLQQKGWQPQQGLACTCEIDHRHYRTLPERNRIRQQRIRIQHHISPRNGGARSIGLPGTRSDPIPPRPLTQQSALRSRATHRIEDLRKVTDTKRPAQTRRQTQSPAPTACQSRNP